MLASGEPTAKDLESGGLMVPFAVELYQRYAAGETVEELSLKFGICRERVEQRLRVAKLYVARHELLLRTSERRRREAA
jgi:hypothetical protein